MSALVSKSGFIPYVSVYSKGFNFDSIDNVSFQGQNLNKCYSSTAFLTNSGMTHTYPKSGKAPPLLDSKNHRNQRNLSRFPVKLWNTQMTRY